ELIGDSQVIKGYTENSNTDLVNKDKRNADFSDLEAARFTQKAGGAATFQAPIFIDTDGASGTAEPVFTTLYTADASTGIWQSSRAIGSGATAVPAKTDVSLADIKAAVGEDYRVIAFGVNNETGTSIVSDITFDGAKYTFANNAPVARNRSYKTKIDRAVTVNLAATDAEKQPLTYTIDSVTSGTMTVAGTAGTFTPDKGFKGDVVAKYTVKDNRGGTASAAITIKVEKLKGAVSIYRTHPTKPSIRSTVYLYATVMTDGRAASKGSTVYGYAKGKKVVTGKVNSSGKVKLKLPNKLPYGKATLKVTQAGSSKLSGGSDTVVVRVKK
ncbi:MAG: cadherin-like domain-containing protein, partial [Aeromicrobium sp.]